MLFSVMYHFTVTHIRAEVVLRAMLQRACRIGELCRILVRYYSFLFVKLIVLINSAVICCNYVVSVVDG